MLGKATHIYGWLWCALAGAAITACGLASPDYKAYEIEGGAIPPGTTDETDDEGDCDAALTAWKNNMKSTVDSTCAAGACHLNNVKLDLQPGADDDNRTALSAVIKGDVKNLTATIHSSAHNGGDLTSVLPASRIEAWYAAEAACQ